MTRSIRHDENRRYELCPKCLCANIVQTMGETADIKGGPFCLNCKELIEPLRLNAAEYTLKLLS